MTTEDLAAERAAIIVPPAWSPDQLVQVEAYTAHECRKPAETMKGTHWDCDGCGLRWYPARGGGWRLSRRSAALNGTDSRGRPKPKKTAVVAPDEGVLTVHADVAQRSEAWYALRLGIVSASTVGRLLTPTLKPADNDTSRRTLLTLAGERITGWAEPNHISPDMWRGIDEEPLAREAYSEHFVPVRECGFMVRDFGGFSLGLSPDGLVGDDGLIEIKSRLHHTQLSTVLADDPVPTTVMAQLQTALLVSGRSWIDYISYSAGMALWVHRVLPDPVWQRAIRATAAVAEERIAATIATYHERTAGLPVMGRTPDGDEIEVS